MLHFIGASGVFFPVVLVFGVAALVASVRYARAPGRRQRSLAIGWTSSALIAGLLATFTGFQKSAGAMSQLEEGQRWLILLGLSEALNNLVVALFLAAIVSVVLTIGAYRSAGRDGVTA